MASFFFGAAVWGRLRLRDIPDWGQWNADRIVYWDETYIDGVSRLALLGEKVRSAAALDDALGASLEMPGIRALWIHQDLLDEAEHRWTESRRTVQSRREARAPVAVAAAVAVAFLAGAMAFGPGPAGRAPVPVPGGEAARITSGPTAEQPAGEPSAVRPASRSRTPANASHRPDRRAREVYAVSVGTFASPVHADRMKHLVQSRGYIVLVVRRGAASQVMTPPYRTRAQAERVAHGLEGAGLPAHLTAWRAP